MNKHSSTRLRFGVAIAALGAAFMCSSVAAYAGPRDTPVRACAAKAYPSLVVIEQTGMIKGDDGKVTQGMALGSGFVIDSRGFILTNEHVIDGAQTIKLKLETDAAGDSTWRPARVVFADKEQDLAILQIAVDKPLPELTLGTASDAAIGEPAIVMGNPFGDNFSLSAGVISKLHVLLGNDPNGDHLIQTDASVNHGNSGGPIFNADCEVIGVVEAKVGDAGIGLAITADRAARFAASYMNAEWAGVSDGILAVNLQVVSPDGADRQWVIVKEMAVDSPAAAVLKLGDRIVSVGGMAIHNRFDLERSVWDNKPGDKVKVTIVRGGQQMDVVMTLAAAPPVTNLDD